jgi:hypothetical protein
MEQRGASLRNDACADDVEPGYALVEPVRAISRLRRLPPGPFRSLGKHLDYAGWAGRERFMELDRAILREGRETQSAADAGDESEEHQTGPSLVDFIRGLEAQRFRRL